MKRGFSLIETLVATAIIVMAATGPLALAARSLGQANYIKDQIVATFLAQEGLEIMRNVRDVNGITAISGFQLGACSSIGTGCTVSGTKLNTDGKTYEVLPATSNPQFLKFSPVTNVYDYTTDSGTANSIYSRIIKIDPPPSGGKEYKIHSKVTWTRASGPRSVDLTENLFERTKW